jgi:hypothetical protein
VIIQVENAWRLTDRQICLVREHAKDWRVRMEVGKRPTTCRDCGELIRSGESRLSFRHFSFQTRCYDLAGFVHADESLCTDNKLLDSYTDMQIEILKEEEHERTEINANTD